jgi:hypothetical protein
VRSPVWRWQNSQSCVQGDFELTPGFRDVCIEFQLHRAGMYLAGKHGEVGLLYDAQPLQQVRKRATIHELHDHDDASALKVGLK